MRKIVIGALTLVSMGCLFGTSRILKTDATVAIVDGRTITVASFDSTVKQLQKNYAPSTPVDSLKQAALDSLIAHKLIEIRSDSIKHALNSDWEFRQSRLDNINQTIMQVLFEKQIAPRVQPDSATVEKQFANNQDKYKDPEQVKARHILIRRPKPDTAGVTSERKRKRLVDDSDKFARDRAEAVLKKALAGENWDTLAATYSEDKSNSGKGGDLGFFGRGRMVPEFDSIAFNITPGKIAGPIDTKFGYHVIKVEEHKQAAPKKLDSDLWNQIYSDIVNEQQGQLSKIFLDSLKATASYVYNEGLLGLPDSSLNDRDWAMVVNNTDTVFAKTMKDSLPKYKRWKQLESLTVADKKDMLNLISSTYLLRSAAKVMGYMQDPKIVKAADETTNIEANLRMSRHLRVLDYEPGEDEVANYFNSHIDDYKEKRPLLVYHILFQDSLMAEAVRDSIVAGADFAVMAKRYYPGDPEIREVLYNLDYIGPEEMGERFFRAADSLQVGDISHAIKTNWGYHLIKLVNRKQDRTQAQVRPGIKQHLKDVRDAEKTRGIVAEWRQGAIVSINQKVFKQYRLESKKVIHIESKRNAQKGG